MRIGPYELRNNVILAPMAGVTDVAFRRLCVEQGAGLAVSEMVTANPKLRDTQKSQRRVSFDDETHPRSVQIAGAVPEELAEAARYNVGLGAELIDINMGCPAKKVCKRAAGSALLKDEVLVGQILNAVVRAVDVPVTLKIRTGWDQAHRNAVHVARMAELEGIQAIAVHGRTRACGFVGDVEYDTIGEVKKAVSIPVIANGDITTPEKAKDVLTKTGADAVMIGRAAQGHPWIFREMNAFLETGVERAPPSASEVGDLLVGHLSGLYGLYGEYVGVRVARKHLSWYCKRWPDADEFWKRIRTLNDATEQLQVAREHFQTLAHTGRRNGDDVMGKLEDAHSTDRDKKTFGPTANARRVACYAREFQGTPTQVRPRSG
ncbi:MAG: tRNA dihydrouridine synthase DusB [Pseudomonadota bacterium]